MKMKSLGIAVVALLLFGCGGSNWKPNLVDNKTLGKFPSVFIEQHNEHKRLTEAMSADMRSARNEEDARKLRDKYVARGEEVDMQAKEIAVAELDRIIGRNVPFEVAYDDPNFEIRSVVIDSGDIETGALTMAVVVGAKKDMTASMDTRIKYQVLDSHGNLLFIGAINPFVSNQIITSQNFPHGTEIAAGEVCSWQGSWLMLYCGSYDFRDFDKIVFVE